MLVQMFLILLLVWVLVIRWRNRDKIKLSKLLKNDLATIPLLGISHQFIGSDEDRMIALNNIGHHCNQLGGLTHMWLGHRFFCVCTDPVDAEFVLKNCLQKDDILKFARVLTGNGSIFAPVPIWRLRRKALARIFALRNLKPFVSIFSEQSNIMVNKLSESANKGPFSIWNYITSYTMDSVGETAFGIKLGIQKQPNHPFLESLTRLSALMSKRILQPWLHNDIIYKCMPYYKDYMRTKNYILDFVSKVVNEQQAVRREKSKKTKCGENIEELEVPTTKALLELLVESSNGDKGFTNLELKEESLVILLAGTDTSAVGASFATVLLSKHPNVQEKLYQEIREVLGDTDRPITSDDLPRFKYMDVVVKESLRLYPPVPIIARMTEKDVILPSGVKLVADAGVVIHIWSTHRNPKYWGEDAEIFRPERFFDSPPQHPAAFMPFSFGPRSCSGYQYATMSMKVVLANLIRRYQIVPTEHIGNECSKPLRVKYDIMLKHVDNFKLQLVSRQ